MFLGRIRFVLVPSVIEFTSFPNIMTLFFYLITMHLLKYLNDLLSFQQGCKVDEENDRDNDENKLGQKGAELN